KQQGFEATEQLLPLQLRGPGLGSLRATTDMSGRFRLFGLGSGRLVALRVSGPSVATATIIARTERGPQVPVFNLSGFIWPQPYGCFGADLAITTSAGRPIMGVVRDLKTGKPVAGAVVHSHRFAGSAL